MEFIQCDFSGITSFVSVSWSYFQDICAAITVDGVVHFFDKKGNELEIQKPARDQRATCISWSANSDLLAIGWADGAISLFSTDFHFVPDIYHENTIVKLEWHPSLPFLLSIDENNTVCCWEYDEELLLVFDASAPFPIEHICFAHSSTPQLFVASENKLFILDEECVDQEASEEEEESFSLRLIDEYDSNVMALNFTSSTNSLLINTKENSLVYYDINKRKKCESVKLSKSGQILFTTIRADFVTYAIGDAITISAPMTDKTLLLRFTGNATSLHFDTLTSTLAVTTDNDTIVFWKCTMKSPLTKAGWSEPTIFKIPKLGATITWSESFFGFSSYGKGSRALLFYAHQFVSAGDKVWQTAGSIITSDGINYEKISSPVDKLYYIDGIAYVISSRQIICYNIRNDKLIPLSSQPLISPLCVVVDKYVYNAKNTTLEKRDIQGNLKYSTNIGSEYPIKYLVSCGAIICAITEVLEFFVYNTSNKSLKLLFNNTFSAPYPSYRIRNVSISCNGFCAAITIDIFNNGRWRPAPYLFLNSPQFDRSSTVAFGGRIPIKHMWDPSDSRFLAVEAAPYRSTLESAGRHEIIPLFVSDTLEDFKQETVDAEDGALVDIDIPYVVLSLKDHRIRKLLPQFEGLDLSDPSTKGAIIELNYRLATGDVEGALDSVAAVDNPGTWRSIAAACAQVGRADLVGVCLGKTGDAAASILIRASGDDAERSVNASLALGDPDKAVRAAAESGRADLALRVHKGTRDWGKAVGECIRGLRVDLKATKYLMGRSLELRGDIPGAVKAFEESGCIERELPALALHADDVSMVFRYVEEHPGCLQLTHWVARFLEAHNQVEKALELYKRLKRMGDYVRLLCVTKQWEKASEYVKHEQKPSVICKLARFLMERHSAMKTDGDDVSRISREILDLFRRARQFSQAVQFAIANDLEDEIMSLSFSAPPAMVVRSAQYFEGRHKVRESIVLYARAGRLNRALMLCFSKGQYEALEEISDGLSSKTDPEVLITCGRHFLESKRWSRASECFALARRFDLVERINAEHSVKISRRVIDDLLKSEDLDRSLMEELARMCERQNDLAVAATLYVKLRDFVSGVKCLARSGDTSKVIKFAKLSRSREVYIIAANYLQTLDVHGNDNIFEIVCSMYEKAGAFDKLSKFLESLSRQCADEFQEYDRSFDLLKRSVDAMMKSDHPKRDQYLAILRDETRITAMYIEATRAVEKNPKQAMAICTTLLKTPAIEKMFKLDDIYIVMVEALVAVGDMKRAQRVLEDLRQSGTDLSFYLDADELRMIYEAAGAKYEGAVKEESDGYDEVEDFSGVDIE